MYYPMTVGRKILQVLCHKTSQVHVAKRIGVTKVVVCQWMNGYRKPAYENRKALVEVFGLYGFTLDCWEEPYVRQTCKVCAKVRPTHVHHPLARCDACDWLPMPKQSIHDILEWLCVGCQNSQGALRARGSSSSVSADVQDIKR